MIPSKIKAAVLFEKEHNLKIVELDLPELMFGQVLVKVIYSGVCRSQIMEVKGLRGEDVWLPHLLGHEAFGIVLKIGPGVSKLGVGEEVIISWIKGDGIDAPGQFFSKMALKSMQVRLPHFQIIQLSRKIGCPGNHQICLAD